MNNQVRRYLVDSLSSDVMEHLDVAEISALSDEDIDRLLAAAILRAVRGMDSRANANNSTMDSLKTSSAMFQVAFVCGIVVAVIGLLIYVIG